MEFFLVGYVVVALMMAVVSALSFIFFALNLRDARENGESQFSRNSYRNDARSSIRYLLFSPIWPVAAGIGLFNLVREVYKNDNE